MRNSLFLIAILCLLTAVATSQETANTALQVWSVPIGSFTSERAGILTKAVFTPVKAIVVRRVEAFGERGPVGGIGLTGEFKPCPVQFSLLISNGTRSQVVPISKMFVRPNSSETYTDSGGLNLRFDAGARITLSLVVPKPAFPPAQCTCTGLNVAVQYEAASAGKPGSSSGTN